jgi:hypothetical protein
MRLTGNLFYSYTAEAASLTRLSYEQDCDLISNPLTVDRPKKVLGKDQISRPHCRDAPWGVSEAEKTVKPLDSPTPGTETAAPETPHGASLQWEGDTFQIPSKSKRLGDP